ncbi:HD-GYP domain-containing protein [Paenibacillus sp. N3.4]|uniref:HD-GYP domain-containing protein n=1 Tax=Paenibacillus sp. N3.4 TaxID=2603222 RepID=UPI0011CB66AB|nr:HD domain-containing phosphohydrolase [Paenibacillus sp. N3.4]TXK74134.1 HD domain-containing protein [Paenibacillus sp. N3.4]
MTFLTKPFDRTEVLLRMQNLLRSRMLHCQLQDNNEKLEERIFQRTVELRNAKDEILQLLGRAGEYRDDMTGKHTQRVGELSEQIARHMNLTERQVELIGRAAPLHDIGKIGISDDLLLKPGRYEPQEYERMKLHTAIGASILEGSRFDLLMIARSIAYSHHEKWDGTGYPLGLQGDAIPLEARIVAIADFYDALTHERPYKNAWTHEEAAAEIANQCGRHFDPAVVEAFMKVFK